MSAGKGSGRRPTLVPKEVADDSWERIFGNREPRVGTPEREAWQDEKNRRARELLDSMPIRKEELSQVKENEQPETDETSRSG